VKRYAWLGFALLAYLVGLGSLLYLVLWLYPWSWMPTTIDHGTTPTSPAVAVAIDHFHSPDGFLPFRYRIRFCGKTNVIGIRDGRNFDIEHGRIRTPVAIADGIGEAVCCCCTGIQTVKRAIWIIVI